jgi:hypothetical protein
MENERLAKVNEYQRIRQNREGIESCCKEADMSATNTPTAANRF